MRYRGVLLAAALLFPTVPGEAYSDVAAKRVLVVFAHDANSPGASMFMRNLHAAVHAELTGPVEFYHEMLDLDRFPGRGRWPQLGRYFADKYRGFRLDGIVAEGSQALQFVTEYLRPLFPQVPVIFGMAFEPVADFSTVPPNVTGRRMPLPFAGTFTLARALQPDAERVVLVCGSSNMDSILMRSAVAAVTPLLGRMQLIVMQDWKFDGLLANLRRMPPRTIVLLSSFRRDKADQVFNTGDLIATVTRVSAAPVYGIARNWIGDGVVGGAVMDFAHEGTQTGRLLVSAMRRPPGAAMPALEIADAPYVVDWRQLKHWHLAEKRLPPDTEVMFRSESAWQRYRETFVMAGFIMLAQALLIGLLLFERRHRLRAQRTAAEQTAFEQMMAEMATDTLRHASDAGPQVLEHALARVCRYAAANGAVLIVYPGTGQPQTRLVWPVGDEGNDALAEAEHALDERIRLDVPLSVGSAPLGKLEIYRAAGWPALLAQRVEAAAQLIAAALDRAQEAHILEQAREEIARMSRLASMGELAAAISHELRQPLTAIRADAAAGVLLLDQAPPSVGEVRTILQDIDADNARVYDIVEHVRLLLSEQGKSNTDSVDMNAVCRQVVRLAERRALLAEVSFDLWLDPDLPEVRGDALQLQQVMLNITLNAIDAAAASQGARMVTLGTAASSNDVQVFVRDTGAGLTPRVQRHLFESFFTTKPRALGLGLAVVQAIVEQHGGLVKAENGAAGGAVFTVVLPVANRSVHRGAQLNERLIHGIHPD